MSRLSSAPLNNLRCRILIGLLLLGLAAILSAGLLLKQGIRFDSLSSGQAAISNFSLQWRDRLELQIDTVTITGLPQETSPLSLKSAAKILKRFQRWGKLFSRISINQIAIGELSATLSFDRRAKKKLSFFTLTSKDFSCRGVLNLDQDVPILTITEASSQRFQSQARGTIRFSPHTEQLEGTLSVNIGGALPITFGFSADKNHLSFQGRQDVNITTLFPLLDLFCPNHIVHPWLSNYLHGSSYLLKSLTGTLSWSDPQSLLDTLYAEVRVNDCEYTIAPGLEPIKSDYTDVVLKKGVLTITPHNGSFYGQKTGTSWVDINLTDPANVILRTHLRTQARINEDIQTLLNSYNISLPCKQTAGTTKIELTLSINLTTDQVAAKGHFFIKEGMIKYGREHFGISDARITLQDNVITIEHASICFKELFLATVSGRFQPTTTTGDLQIVLEQFTFKGNSVILSLNEANPRPIIRYHIHPDGHSLAAAASAWNLNGMQLNFGPFSTPFSPENLSGVLPPTAVTSSTGISTQLSGSFSIQEKVVNFHCDLDRFQGKELALTSPDVPIAIRFDRKLTIRTKETSHWKVKGRPMTLYPSTFSYESNILSMTDTQISYGHFLDSQISGEYDKLSGQGTFLLQALHLKEKNIGSLFQSTHDIPIEVRRNDDTLTIQAPELDLEISKAPQKNWSVTFKDLAAIHPHSPFLQHFRVNGGILTISSEQSGKSHTFSADLPSPYPFLIKEEQPVERLTISGKITSQGLRATVNEGLQFHYNDQLNISSTDLSYNIPVILKFLKEHPKSEERTQQKQGRISWTVEASNSNLFLTPNHQVLSDRLHIEHVDGKTTLHLEHKKGTINLKSEGESFSLVGQHLNDTFMNALMEGTAFQKGAMNMVAEGSFHNFSLLIKIQDTLLRNFKLLNNSLALLDTIPALATFSLPQYEARGLPVSSAVAGMVVKEGVATFKSFTIDSPELNMIGKGWINFPENQIDMDFNLITKAKKNIQKIPLLGYLLVGKEERPSITLHASGNLLDPEINASIFREITALPFSILFRTLVLPSHLMDSMTNFTEEKEHKQTTKDGGLQSTQQESHHQE